MNILRVFSLLLLIALGVLIGMNNAQLQSFAFVEIGKVITIIITIIIIIITITATTGAATGVATGEIRNEKV
uniref:DUF1328 domain-containing protein n=1 Tax=Globodera pallida TaxID=36090 RepID=A0A183CA53_GLOPA